MITHHQNFRPVTFSAGRRDGLISLRGRLDTPLTRREAGSNPSHFFPSPEAVADLRNLSHPSPTLWVN